jgi:two-component system cell cycle sensor histidine kinase/response regulator CckA
MLFPPTESAEIATAADQGPAAGGAGQLVLVVDDEPLIRDLLNSVLTESGYRVLTAEDGASGLDLFKQQAAEISIVMIDMMMPVLYGYKAIPLMHQIRPDTQFIAISGLMQPADLAQTAPTARVEVLRKPFTGQKALETLARIQK